ncbi:MAG: PCRF domain-containing protein, partial [Muribaculaceae bacterium]|nr:PCRF domain-containing protein [Muribaculaceae bacterium]
MITQEQLKELQQRKEDLKRYLDIDGKKIEVEEEELRTHVPNFWQDQKAAEAQMKKIKSLRNWINGCEEVELAVDEVATGFDFVKEGLVEESELDSLYSKAMAMLEKMELRNILRHDEDKMDAILKINSGAGGTESQDWASMLMRMYLRWCERHGYKTSIEHLIDGDEAGIKSVTISIEGDFAY